MALAHSPSTVTNGLTFYYDMANAQKSWQGRPTVNLVSNPNAAINVTTDDVPQEVKGKNVMGYAAYSTDYAVLTLPTTSTPSTGKTFTYSIWMRSPGAQSTYLMYVFDGTGPDGGWYGFAAGALTSEWQRYTGTVSGMTGTVQFIRIYRLNQVGTIQIAAPQFEESAFATPFIVGTRTANINLEDAANFPTWNAAGGSSASAGTLTFGGGSHNSKGVWDLYKTYSGLATGVNYTWSALVRAGTANNFIVTMNNTQSWNTGPSAVFTELSGTALARISITGTTNTGSFNLHLGSSANSEVAGTVQNAGTILIQDVSLALSGNQTSLTDLTGQNAIGANSLTYASDGTFSFNGASNFINLDTNIQAGYTSASYEFWCRPTSLPGSGNYFQLYIQEASTWIALYNVGAGAFFGIDLHNGAGWFDGNGGSVTGARTTTSLTANTDYYIAYSWNGSTVSVYLNGNLQATVTTLQAANGRPNVTQLGAGGTPRNIGSRGNGTANNWVGTINSVKFYNRALSAAEVQQNFTAHRSRYGI